MSTPPDDTETTWRELADQLRPEQIAELDGWERGGHAAAALLFTARVWAAENVTDTVEFTTVERRFGGTAIYVNGRQFDDGRCERGSRCGPTGPTGSARGERASWRRCWHARPTRSSSASGRRHLCHVRTCLGDHVDTNITEEGLRKGP
jgi:hypothetical protein